MLLTIHYSPEMNVWTVHNGQRERVILEEDFAPGSKLEPCAEAFRQAKEAVVSGRAVLGIHVEV